MGKDGFRGTGFSFVVVGWVGGWEGVFKENERDRERE